VWSIFSLPSISHTCAPASRRFLTPINVSSRPRVEFSMASSEHRRTVPTGSGLSSQSRRRPSRSFARVVCNSARRRATLITSETSFHILLVKPSSPITQPVTPRARSPSWSASKNCNRQCRGFPSPVSELRSQFEDGVSVRPRAPSSPQKSIAVVRPHFFAFPGAFFFPPPSLFEVLVLKPPLHSGGRAQALGLPFSFP